jgi:hypothetical protein
VVEVDPDVEFIKVGDIVSVPLESLADGAGTAKNEKQASA